MKKLSKAKLPDAIQSGILPEVYARLAANPQCARLGIECSSPCEVVDENGMYPVELDHIVAKSAGGMNSIDNLQWLCACENRKKYSRPDVRYSGDLYFDREIDIRALRPHQLSFGYGLAVGEYADLFRYPEKIYQRFALLAWLVGAGKTVGMLSILFGINHIRKSLGNGSAKRIKRVLWLVHQRSLVEALANELSTELTKYGIADKNPEVTQVTDAAKWGYNADIIVACPQALWDADNNSLTDARRAEILGGFDAIIVDEAQFGIDHYLSLAMLAPAAFKFAVTATPMDGNGRLFSEMDNGIYRNHFALFSIFGYEVGRKLGIYKEILEFKDGKEKGYYEGETGGVASIRDGDSIWSEENTKIPSLPRNVAIVKKARNIAIAAGASSNYDHHVMVRVGTILEAKGLVKALESTNDVIGVWAGCKGPSLGSDKHPWMLAKKNEGRITTKSKRIVITIDIGQFGINNPLCSMIVWLDPNRSLVELVQRIGRAIRRSRGQTDSPVKLFWNSAHDGFEDYLEDAIDYILNMPLRLQGFPALSELGADPKHITPSPIAAAVKSEDRVSIASVIGEKLLSGIDIDVARHQAVRELSDRFGWSDRYAERVDKYAEKLTSEEGRSESLNIPDVLVPAKIVLNEDPERDYSPDKLIRAINNMTIKIGLDDDLKVTLIDRIKNGDALSIADCRQELEYVDRRAREIEELTMYSPMEIAWKSRAERDKNPLPFETYTEIVTRKYMRLFTGKRVALFVGEVVKPAIFEAIASHFGMPNFKRDTYQPFEKQLSDAMMREDHRRSIIGKAEIIIIQNRKKYPELAGIAKLYESQVAEEYRHAS